MTSSSCLIHSLLSLLIVALFATSAGAAPCPPTEPDEVGPFYKPNAPQRSKIGTGYVLSGTVRSTLDCRPIPHAVIEFWQTGPAGEYGDDYRATVKSDRNGSYRLETYFPSPYMTRPPHIHILVQAPGFQRLITQHYPRKGTRKATFDLVLTP